MQTKDEPSLEARILRPPFRLLFWALTPFWKWKARRHLEADGFILPDEIDAILRDPEQWKRWVFRERSLPQ